MSPKILLRTTGRVLRQLSHDRRTIAMIIVLPLVLLTLVYYLFQKQSFIFDRIGLIMIGLFPFILMFLITSIAMLRERTTGTLERLLTTPLHKLDLLFGYGIAFGVLAGVQASIGAAPGLLGLRPQHRRQPRPGHPHRGGRRGARHGAGPVLQRLRLQRVPGGAVHAAGRLPAGLPLWTVHPARPDGRLAARDLRRASR